MMDHIEIEEAGKNGGVKGKYTVAIDTFNSVADAVQNEDDVLGFWGGNPQTMFYSLLSMKGIKQVDYPAIVEYAKEVGLKHDFFYSLMEKQ